MASSVPPVKNAQYIFEMGLISQDDTDIFKTSVTLAAGDVVVYQDGVLDGNIDALPSEIGSSGVLVVTLSADEMNCDRVTVKFCDQAGDEWQDAIVTIHTVAQTLDTIDTNVDAILADTGTDGVVVKSYTTAGKAEVQSEVNDALVAVDLDHLAKTSAGSAEPADGTWLDQIMHKSAGQTFDATTDSLEALRDHIGPTATVTVVAGVSGDAITVVPYTTWEFTISGLSDLSGAAANGVFFTVKERQDDADTAALLMVQEGVGLLYINGAAGTAAKASLTVAGSETSITVHVNASQTGLKPGTYQWDVKQVITVAEDADQMASGVFTVSETGITQKLTTS